MWKDFVPAWQKWWADHETYVGIARAVEGDPSDAHYAKLSEFGLVTIGTSFGEAESRLNKLVEINRNAAHTTAVRPTSARPSSRP